MKILSIIRKASKVPWSLVIDEFKGVASLLDDVILGAKFAKEALNLYLTQDGRWSTRWGTAYYGLAITGETKIIATGKYIKSDKSQEKIAICSSGKAYKSVDGGAWSEITGATFTTTAVKYDFEQANNYLYISNGVDRMTRYNGSVLFRYTPLSAPTGVSASRNVLAAGSYHNYYRITAVPSSLNDVVVVDEFASKNDLPLSVP